METLTLTEANATLDQPFLLSTDTSGTGCRAVLSQWVEGRYRPVAYFSRRFTPTERRYETVEKEVYAVALAVRCFHHLVDGQEALHIYSDQRSLSMGIKQSNSPRMMRWIQQLTEYDVQTFYQPGSKN